MEDGNQTLFCVRRLLWNQIQTLLDEINMNGNGAINSINSDVNYVGGYRNYRPRSDGARNYDFQNRSGIKNKKVTWDRSSRQKTRPNSGKSAESMMCGACFRAGKPQSEFLSHHYEDCRNLSSTDKRRMFKAAIRMIDNNYEDASSESEADDEKDNNEQ